MRLDAGDVVFGGGIEPAMKPRERIGQPVTPQSRLGAAPVQVGVLGVLRDGRDFAAFPPAAIARVAA